MENKVKRFSFILVFLCAWLVLLSPSCRAAWPVPPPPTQDIYLVDDAGMVEPGDRQKILTMGRDLDHATKAQVVVVTMTTLEDESIESYANRLFRSWGIGDKKKNNGVLLLIAKEDRKFRIEVGYGLEGAITDGFSGSVLDGMKADFRKGNYSPAIVAAYGKLTQKAYEAENMAAPENVGTAVAATGAMSSSSSSSEDDDEEWSWTEILLGLPIGLLLIGALLWCLWQMLRMVFMLCALLLFLLTSGAVDLTDYFSGGGGGGGGGGGFSGGGWSGGGGGGGFGGGSSGGGGSSSGW